MARTDVHRPYWVQEHDPYCRHEFRVQHNHWLLDEWDPELKRHLVKLSVPCDLHLRDDEARIWTRCSPTFVGTRGCCRLCAGRPTRRRKRRQERHGWRAMRHQLLAAQRGGHHDLDVPPIRAKAW